MHDVVLKNKDKKPTNKNLAYQTYQHLCLAICLFTSIVLTALNAPRVNAQQASDDIAPEFSSPAVKTSLKDTASPQAQLAQEFIAVTAHPLATKAAYQVLANDGSAVDAMIVAQTVLGLVEPQSSGLGGGAFTLYYDANNQVLKTFDGRETAPLKATPELFMANQTSPMQFFDAVVGGRSVGTPGTVKLLGELHKRYGTVPWADLLQPAIQLAKSGFEVSPRLAYSVARDQSRLKLDKATAEYFLPKGKPIETDSLLKNPDYAQTLEALAKHGANYFYDSAISKAIIEKVKQSANPGQLRQKDFAQYKVIERAANCFEYKAYSVCGMGPPSSGAITVNQILGMLAPLNLSKRSPGDPMTWQLIAEASRLAFADREQYIADPNFFKVPVGLTDKQYLQARSTLITPGQASTSISAGKPPGLSANRLISGNSPEQNSTTHFVIVDKQGNIISSTSTIENAFGSRLLVKGFLLNNELTDFSFSPTKDGNLIANRVEPGKRPRSSMAPTIVFHKDSQEPYLALGSPGGSRIINFVANALISVLDWQEDLQTAFNRPHIVNRFGTMELEQDTAITEWQSTFEKMGYPVAVKDINSGLHGVMFTPQGLIGAADQRREGFALGK